MRHPALPFVALAAAALLAGACGGDDDSSTAAGTEPADVTTAGSPVADSDAAFPVTIEHKYGSTTIEAEPTRVVSVGFNDQDALLALGVTPIGIRDWYGEQPFATWPWAQDELGDAEPELLSPTAPSSTSRQVAALEPDLIVGIYSGMTESEYDLAVGDRPDDRPAERVRRLRHAVAGADPHRRRARWARRSSPRIWSRRSRTGTRRSAPSTPSSTAPRARSRSTFEGSPGAYASSDVRSRLLADLGFVIPPEFDEIAGDSFFASFSAEELELLDLDTVVWIVGDDLALDAILELPLRRARWRSRRRVARCSPTSSCRVRSRSRARSASRTCSTQLVPKLAAAVDGDPATAVPDQDIGAGVDAGAPAAGELDDDQAAAALAYETVFDSATDADAKAEFLPDVADLAPTIEAYTAAGDGMGGITMDVSAVVVDGDTATVTYDVLFGGNPAYSDLTGTLVRAGDTWTVTRDEFCSFMASARTPCP